MQVPIFKCACINLAIGVIGIVFFLLIPIISECPSCNFQAFQNSQIEESLKSVEVRISGTALLISACPMALDLIMDLVSGPRFASDKSKQCWGGRVAITLVTLMVGVQIAIGYDYFHLSCLYTISFRLGLWCLRIILSTTFMSFLCIANPIIFTLKQTVLISILSVATASFKFYAATTEFDAIFVLSKAITFSLFVTIVILFSLWSRKLWLSRNEFTVDNYTCVYILSVSVITAFTIFSNSIYALIHGSSNYSGMDAKVENLVVQIYIHTACCVIMSIIPGRIARIESIVSKDHVIETKEAYVRYISHELRTPLNTVYMGLQLSTDQIPADTTDPIEKERRSTLLEISYACEVALDILNDLLLYDKLQNGLVSLTKEKLNILDFMSKCINMFTVQLRSKKLHVVFYGSDTSSNLYGLENDERRQVTINNHRKRILFNSALTIDDTINADKSKLGQVIRNLLSNAIKFTPDGGHIQISIDFIPSSFILEDDDHNANHNANHNNTNSLLLIDDDDYDRSNHQWKRQFSRHQLQSEVSSNTAIPLEASTTTAHPPTSSQPHDDDEEEEEEEERKQSTSWTSNNYFLSTFHNTIYPLIRTFSSSFTVTPASRGTAGVSLSADEREDTLPLSASNKQQEQEERRDYILDALDLSELGSSSPSRQVSNRIPREEEFDTNMNKVHSIHNIHNINNIHSNINKINNIKDDLSSDVPVHSNPFLSSIQSVDTAENESKNTSGNDAFHHHHSVGVVLSPVSADPIVNNNTNTAIVNGNSVAAVNSNSNTVAAVNNNDSTVNRNTATANSNTVMTQKGMLVVQVKDSGVGISIDDQERLFKEIIQFKPEVLQGGGGSGLELFITKGIVDLHGGKISVHSEGEGKGTMFRIEIPMTRTIVTSATASTASKASSSATATAAATLSLTNSGKKTVDCIRNIMKTNDSNTNMNNTSNNANTSSKSSRNLLSSMRLERSLSVVENINQNDSIHDTTTIMIGDG